MPFDPKHIVVPVSVENEDEFALACQAAEAGADLAAAMGGRLTLLFVGPNLQFAEASYPGLQVQAYKSLREILEQRVQYARNKMTELRESLDEDIPIEAHVITNHTESVPKAICAEADELGADLIVISSHGRKGIARAFLGSVAERVAHIASQPVLLLRVPKK